MFARRLLSGTPRTLWRAHEGKAALRDHTHVSRILTHDFDGFYRPPTNDSPVRPEVEGAFVDFLDQMPVPTAMPSAFKKAVADYPRGQTQKQLKDVKIGFIGWGSMAQAISLGLLREAATVPENIMVSGRRQEVLAAAEKEGMAISMSNKAVAEWADIVVIAVKPQMLDDVMPELVDVWHKDKLLVSVCAGVPIDSFLQTLGNDAKVVRTMPNTPCMIGEAATAYAGSGNCLVSELDLVKDMFSAVGKATHQVPERLMNAVTGVSGSGPAYIYMLIQAMSDAGVHSGLPRDISLSLATQTVIGAAKMVQTSGKHPAVLKEAVTSPAGTTIAGVKSLELSGFNASVMQAVYAATSRAEELSKLQPSAPKRQVRNGARRLRQRQ